MSTVQGETHGAGLGQVGPEESVPCLQIAHVAAEEDFCLFEEGSDIFM